MDYKEKLISLLNSKDLSEEQKAKLDEIFPELQESEDERISKALIRVIKRYAEGYENVEAGLSVSDAIAWLEKQGEQKSAWSEEDEKEELLEKAISLILDLTEDDPEAMCDVIQNNEGADYCANNCNNFCRECLMRYLKYYEKTTGQQK